MIRYLSVAAMCGLFASAAFAADDVTPGRKCFDQYVALEAAFDPKAYAMYSDNALITARIITPDGKEKTQQIPASKFKSDILSKLAELKKNNDSDVYKNVKVTKEGDAYWVSAVDHSLLRKEDADMSMQIRVDKQQKCTIDALEMVYKVKQK